MNDSLFVRGFQPHSNLAADIKDFVHRQWLLGDLLRQRFAFLEFHGMQALPVRLLQAIDQAIFR